MINMKILPTISTLNQEKRVWEFTKWSSEGKCFDLLSNSLSELLKEMCGGHHREFVCGYLSWRVKWVAPNNMKPVGLAGHGVGNWHFKNLLSNFLLRANHSSQMYNNFPHFRIVNYCEISQGWTPEGCKKIISKWNIIILVSSCYYFT